jgi:hypothetical protein
MNANEIEAAVSLQIGDAWDTTNAHGVDLREALVPPAQIVVIDRQVRDGQIHDLLVAVWLVLIENPGTRSGYRIVAAADGSMFGLAAEGFPSDAHLVLCGWSGDFMTTFLGM